MTELNFSIEPRVRRGESREEFYTHVKREPFGLNKRTRRMNAGQCVSLPDGTYPEDKKIAEGAKAGAE